MLFLIPLFLTGQGPIPHPECVEIVNNSTILLHADKSMPKCGMMELFTNLVYYKDYTVIKSNDKPVQYGNISSSDVASYYSSGKVTLTLQK